MENQEKMNYNKLASKDIKEMERLMDEECKKMGLGPWPKMKKK